MHHIIILNYVFIKTRVDVISLWIKVQESLGWRRRRSHCLFLVVLTHRIRHGTESLVSVNIYRGLGLSTNFTPVLVMIIAWASQSQGVVLLELDQFTLVRCQENATHKAGDAKLFDNFQ